MPHRFEMIETNGVRIRAAIEGEGPLVVMVHGFPESWYSWRHQMAALAAAGFTACAIDVRGYGGSDKPHAIEAYDMRSITGDVAGVIQALSPNAPAVVIGHDWGAPIAWNTALLHPDKVRAVAGLSVPYTGQGGAPLIHVLRELFTKQGKFFYMVYFQDEGVAEQEFEADVRTALRKLYFAASGDAQAGWTSEKAHGARMLDGMIDPDPFPAWLSAQDIDVFVAEFERSGFRGPINRYRNFERDFEFLRAAAPDPVIRQPSLFIAGERDLVLRMIPGADLVAAMKNGLADLRGVHIFPRIGHWTQQEAADETTGAIIDWLATL